MHRNLPTGHPTGIWTRYDWQSSGQTIPARIAEMADRFPDHLATYDPERRLTYDQLDRAANRVANALLLACGPDQQAVVILAGANVGATIAALGVLKANKFYVGLEASFPVERARQIISDTAATFVLAETAYLSLAREMAGSMCKVVDIDELATSDDIRPEICIPLDATAVVNFTSGSTGKPKGVVQTHYSMRGHTLRYANAYQLSDADRVLKTESLAWAGTFWDLFGPLCLGACVASYDMTRYGTHGMPGWVRETGVTVMSGMTMIIRLSRDYPEERYPDVRLLQLGGDTVYRSDLEACQQVYSNAVAAVGLGMTEAGRVAEHFIPPGFRIDHQVVPVGFPPPGVRILLLDEDGAEVAAGESGEIIVCSGDLAQGYWCRPDLTQEKFCPDPGGGRERRYFSGDIGRMGEDGVLHHLGRKDFQVKIRGYQVATSEVESSLIEIGGVREACVVAARLPDGSQELVAYLAVESNIGVTTEVIQQRLRTHFPDHMVPHHFIFMDRLPRTLTNKVDRNALPARSGDRPQLGTEFVAPRTPFEILLAGIWSEVLGVTPIGIHDGFLDLGGDSLRFTQTLARIIGKFGVDLTHREVMETPTVANLAIVITQSLVETMEAGELARIQGD